MSSNPASHRRQAVLDPFLQIGLNHGLVAACHAHAAPSVQALLAAGADPDAAGAMEACCSVGEVDNLELLLAAGASPKEAGVWLCSQAEPESEAACLRLLFSHGASPDLAMRFGRACSTNRPLAMREMIQAGVEIHWGRASCPIAMLAQEALSSRPGPAMETLKALLEMTDSPSRPDAAARKLALDASLLILAGADAQTSTLCQQSLAEAARLLLSRGARPNTASSGASALGLALQSNRLALATELVLAGADALAPVMIDEKPCLPLSLAASRRDASLLAALLTAGADANATNPSSEGGNALHNAAASYRHGASEDRSPIGAIVRALVNAGADLEALNSEGLSPLAFGMQIFSRDPAFCLAMAEAGANVDMDVSPGRSVRKVVRGFAAKNANSADAAQWREVDGLIRSLDEKAILQRHSQSASLPRSNGPKGL